MSTLTREYTEVFTDDHLIYAAYDRCPCGAGLAHPDTAEPYGETAVWDCSDILTGRAIPSGQPGSKEHTGKLPFVFYEVKSEDQPSANGSTTRPPDVPTRKKPRERNAPKMRDDARMECGHDKSNWIRLPEDSEYEDFCERCSADDNAHVLLKRVQQLEVFIQGSGLTVPDYEVLHTVKLKPRSDSEGVRT